MSATPPEASIEYSRGIRPSGRDSTDPEGVSGDAADSASGTTRGAAGTILAGALLGALLLIVAEFTTLFYVRAATSVAPIKSESTGSHNAYALIPIAALVIVLGVAFWRAASRPALLSIGVLGVIALLIALLGDLPDAHASGLIGSGATHYVSASSTPSAGLYMETLGAVILLITCVCGFLLIGSPRPLKRP
jgi:hypothetical protein